MRQSIAVSSCASSTTIWPYVHSRSAAARCAVNSASIPLILSTSICEVTMPEPIPACASVSLANCSSSARLASNAFCLATAFGSGPSNSMASSSRGTSLTVKGEPFGRVSVSMSRSSSQGAKRRNCCGFANSWSTSHSPVIGSHARFSVLRKSSFIRNCCITSLSSACSGS